ncbi:MAG TPA: glutamate-1-semialdehyde 2,1-aminomutase [Ramlibacter sp.]|jgi:glutamate-1-semialdehyde 2,1-aminomutase|nr:glutamate-1-semialdehyde 2,1-aminomutase [Ramlibacter sp.]
MSGSYSERLHRVIPGGAHTYSRGDDQYPANAPEILVSGKGCRVLTGDGRTLLDYGMGLRAVTIGYADERINRAAMRGMDMGVNLTRASVIELEAAERLVDLIPGADMVKFAKNGSNVTTAAGKVARAFTGRPLVCVPRQHPFFSFDDWFIGATTIKRGVPEVHHATTLLFDYGDLASLRKLFDENPGRIAGVMLEPGTTVGPCDGAPGFDRLRPPTREVAGWEGNFLRHVQALCRQQGALFILDEMITGFRWDLRGAQALFDVQPDLTTFGKGMANGFAVAALVGRREVMEVGAINKPGQERTFLVSTTHGGEMASLAAFLETVDVYEQQGVVRHLWDYGAKLMTGLEALAREAGVDRHFQLQGNAVAMNYVTLDAQGQPSLPLRTLFSQEMIRHGVLMPWIAQSFSHGDVELQQTLDAARQALAVYAQALQDGVERFLEGPAIKPVFRQFN